jgi:dolichyl-phosphate-mannose--protein O-mannosyl transferase
MRRSPPGLWQWCVAASALGVAVGCMVSEKNTGAGFTALIVAMVFWIWSSLA